MKKVKNLKEEVVELFSKKWLIRLLKYTLIGLLSFGFDILILWILTDFIGIYYLESFVIAFILATIFNYSFNRIWCFKGTKTSPIKSYFKFLILALITLGIGAGLMYALVEIVKIYYLIARIIAAALLAISNYIFNAIFVFKMFEKS